jgi:hypothetical protein
LPSKLIEESFNQSEVERDKATRDAIIQEAERRLAEIDQQEGEQHTR